MLSRTQPFISPIVFCLVTLARPSFLKRCRFVSTSVPCSAHPNTHLPSATELYEQSYGRWLFNEAQQQEIRRVNFNVSELIHVACASVGAGSCLSIQKIAEGSFNKIFRLHFDNSQSLIARLPSSRMFGSGVSWAIASEVATMEITREKLNIRVPRVLAWSKDTGVDSVGWPYILLEDVDGVSLDKEWLTPDMRGSPVAKLLTQVANHMHRMTVPPFSQLGSIYFPADLPSIRPLEKPLVLENRVRIGPIADPLWWRSYHDEPHLDRGPWDTLEDYIIAAVRLERRAAERHRSDPSSLCYTKSSVEDLVEVDHLLDKVTTLAPHLQHAIEHSSPFPERFMQNTLLHPDIRAQNVMVPKLTADNSLSRMENPVIIDWQAASVLPLALQFCVPTIAEYEPRLFLPDGKPLLEVRGIEEVAWPPGFDEMDPLEQEFVRAEHRIATRNVRWMELFLTVDTYAHLLAFPLQGYLHLLTQGILRSCADGPLPLTFLLVRIKEAWDQDSETLGTCPYTFDPDEIQRYEQHQERFDRFDAALSQLITRLKCTRDGWVEHKDYKASMRELYSARLEWDEEACGGPFPFEDGRWGQYLR